MTNKPFDLSIALLHDDMLDKQGNIVTTSVTLIDVHDIARSSRTFGATNFFVVHSSPTIRNLVRSLHSHWEGGFGANYNPDRKDALSILDVCESLDEVIHKIDLRSGSLPRIIATSAHSGDGRASFEQVAQDLRNNEEPVLLLLGTGWGMSAELLARAHLFLEPVLGTDDYNHLSVRSACAIMLDRVTGGG